MKKKKGMNLSDLTGKKVASLARRFLKNGTPLQKRLARGYFVACRMSKEARREADEWKKVIRKMEKKHKEKRK